MLVTVPSCSADFAVDAWCSELWVRLMAASPLPPGVGVRSSSEMYPPHADITSLCRPHSRLFVPLDYPAPLRNSGSICSTPLWPVHLCSGRRATKTVGDHACRRV